MLLAWDYKILWSYSMMHNPLWKWAAMLGVLLVSFAVGKTISFLLDRHSRRLIDRGKDGAIAALWGAFAKPVQTAALAGGMYFCQSFLVLDVHEGTGVLPTGPIREMWVQAANGLVALSVAWAFYRLVTVLEHVLGSLTSRTETKLDDQLVPLIRKSLRVFIVIIAGLFIADNVFRWNIGALVAGLGIGGLAFALAAKDSIANLFGSAVIFADQPFALGERIKINGRDGAVEEVGFRSTKIRTLDGNLVIIPNSTVANEMIENVGRREIIKRVLNVGLTYDTPPARMQRAVDILRDMLDARAANFPADQQGRVFFTEFNADNLNIVVYYWFTPPHWWDYLQFTHDFNMELLRRFNEEGLEFAFPTQTLYVRPEGTPPADGASKPGASK